jgi:hypothetical protein
MQYIDPKIAMHFPVGKKNIVHHQVERYIYFDGWLELIVALPLSIEKKIT